MVTITHRATQVTATTDAAVPRTTPVRRRLIAVARIGFGMIWAVDAALKWLPSFATTTFGDKLHDAATGQPPAFASWIHFWESAAATAPTLFAHLLAVAETLLAAALILGAFTNLVAVAGGALSLLIWSTAEAFGGPYSNGTTDVGASIVYVLVFLLLAAAAAGNTWGADAWLRGRVAPFQRLCSPNGT